MCHTLTTKDYLTTSIVTNSGYMKQFAKKLLNLILLAFREENPNSDQYQEHVHEDVPDWDT